MHFSERYGYSSVNDAIQYEGMDEALKNKLWNVLQRYIYDKNDIYYDTTGYGDNGRLNPDSKTGVFIAKIWHIFFKKALDEISPYWDDIYKYIKEFFFNSRWFVAYDFIEFIGQSLRDRQLMKAFCKAINQVLESEKSGYRFVDTKIIKITDDIEINEIEKAINEQSDVVREHLRSALDLLKDRTAPNYRKSIQETISALESYIKIALGGGNETLGQLLKRLEGEISLHKALKSAFSSLYGFTNDGGGIRHGNTTLEDIGFEDALFFLVTHSAFINYVQQKLNKKA